MERNRLAVFVTGISSNVTTDLAENGASTTEVGSLAAIFRRAFLTRVGVTTTWIKKIGLTRVCSKVMTSTKWQIRKF